MSCNYCVSVCAHTLLCMLFASVCVFAWVDIIITWFVIITGSFIEFLIGGLTYPDESVKSAVIRILTQVCSNTSPNLLPLPLMQNISRHVFSNLANSKSKELTSSLLGIAATKLKLEFCETSLSFSFSCLQTLFRTCWGIVSTPSAYFRPIDSTLKQKVCTFCPYNLSLC